MKKVKEHLYIASGTIDMHDPDAYLDDAETRKKKQEEKKKDKDYQVVDEVPYWLNGQGFVNGERTALFQIETEPFSVKRLTAPAFDVQTWIKEGTIVYYAGTERNRRESLFNQLYAYDTESETIRTLYGKDDRSISDLFVLNGNLYVQETDLKEYGVNETPKVARFKEDGFEELFKPGYSLYSSVVGDTLLGGGKNSVTVNGRLITNTTVEDHNEIRIFDENMQAETVYDHAGLVGALDSNGRKIAFVREDWNHLGEIHEIDPDGKNEKVLTHLNDANLEGKYIAEPLRIEYESEGEKLHGWVLLPENFDEKKKYPAVLDVHGGPRCVYGEVFFHEMQVWAAEGFVVMFTNIRGSDGRGDAFADIRDQYGYVDFKNLMDFTDAVLKKYPNIDETKLCETGGSYGGFMSNWILTHTDRFCAIASQRSISNWVSMSFISDIGLYFGPDQCGAPGLFGEKNTQKLWEHSPLAYAQNAKTPTLFIHSDEDYRCPLPEGMQMMQALARQNIETRMCIFHGENHELSRSGKPLHRIRRLEEITKWFKEHVN
jgi:dipeptidyl aminopeptidase/acylaminoacyl peptidase